MTRPASAPSHPGKRPRDMRLDFFRGIALLVILVTHAPGNPWSAWTPGRFGFSDAAEIFVFCSGMASALAFGATYTSRGWILGTARVLQRVWQVYWVHIGSFIVILAAMVTVTEPTVLTRDYIGQLNLVPFLRDPGPNIVGLLTLTYVPNYFDILPMYLVILSLVPLAMAIAGLNRGLLAVVAVSLWVFANLGWINLPAEPWSEREWFFNPFGWQLLFFTGFALAAGWIRPPSINPTLLALAVGFLVLTVPVTNPGIRNTIPALAELRDLIQPVTAKSSQGPLRLMHFLALSYVAWVLVGTGGERLLRGTHFPRVADVLRRTGQQSLAVFVTGLLVSRLMGVAFDVLGRGFAGALLVNLCGIGVCIGTAYLVGWIKGQPWRRPAAAPDAPAQGAGAPSPAAAPGSVAPGAAPGLAPSGT